MRCLRLWKGIDAPRRRRLAERGLSLIESLVSIAVLSMVAISVLGLIVTTLHLDKLAKDRSTATSIARDRVEQVTSQPFDQTYTDYQLADETDLGGTPGTLRSDYGDMADYPYFKRDVVFRYDTPVTGMLTLETHVSWAHINDGERTHTMITYLHPQLE